MLADALYIAVRTHGVGIDDARARRLKAMELAASTLISSLPSPKFRTS